MKKTAVICLLIASIALIAVCFGGEKPSSSDPAAYLRVHIRANSNEEADQAVKYLVRDRIVAYLTPVVAASETKEEAIRAIGQALGGAEAEAERTLKENGFEYGARASLRQEKFPTRVYESVTLPSGVYDALIVELGEGAGDNWWCVVYPPLCFAGGEQNVVYRSKIAEIIADFFGK